VKTTTERKALPKVVRNKTGTEAATMLYVDKLGEGRRPGTARV
jgi:hypothetical protein